MFLGFGCKSITVICFADSCIFQGENQGKKSKSTETEPFLEFYMVYNLPLF